MLPSVPLLLLLAQAAPAPDAYGDSPSAIIGSIAGLIVAIGGLAGLATVFTRRRRNGDSRDDIDSDDDQHAERAADAAAYLIEELRRSQQRDLLKDDKIARLEEEALLRQTQVGYLEGQLAEARQDVARAAARADQSEELASRYRALLDRPDPPATTGP